MSQTIQEIVERETVHDDADDATDDDAHRANGPTVQGDDAGAVDDAAPADAGETGDDTDVGATAASAPSTGPTDAQRRDAIKAGERYGKRIETIYGPESEHLAPCPLCPTVHIGFVDVRDAGKLPVEVVEVVDSFLGKTLPVEYPESPDYTACDACRGPDGRGLGQVKTGSAAPGHETSVCKRCSGYGFRETNPGAAPAVAPINGAAAAPVAPAEDADVWGSPRLLPDGRENPNYGRMPQYKLPEYP